MSSVDKIKWAMSLRDPQYEALKCFDNISSKIEYKTASKSEAEKAASENCQEPHKIVVDKEFDFPSFCFDMTTGIGKTRLMGACIYYLYKTKGYKHFFILCPGNTIYDKMRRETVPGHPKYMFKGLEAEMGRPKVYDGENYLSYPVRYVQNELQIEKTSEIQLFIFNISKIFTRGDLEFKFHKFNENLGGSFADVLRSFDDLVFCMDEAHRYYAPASKTAINYLNPVLGLEFTATPKSTNKNIIFHYGLEEGAGKFLKIPVVMGRTNTAGYSEDDIEEMKLKDGIKLHERRKAIVYKYCIDNGLEQVKPIVLVACKDTTHAKKIKEKIDSDAFFGGRYVGKVIEIDSSTRGEETEENIQKLLTIEQNTNPVEIVLHVYKLKEGWDVNNLFTIIPLNAAKSDILALQTIGRGLRLPFGEITHVEEIDTLDIVAHDHYREIIDDIKDNPVFKKRNLDDEDIPETEAVKVEAVVQDQQISIFDDMFKDANVKSFQEIDTNKDIDNLYEAYQKAYVKKAAPKKKDSKPDGQITIFDLFGSGDDTNSVDTGSKEEQAPTDTTVSQDNIDITVELNEPSKSNVPELYVKEIFKQKVEEFKKVAISVPKISISYSSSIEFKSFTVKRNVMDFDVAASKIERYDAVNNRLLQTLDADPLMVDDSENTLACSLLESIPEFSYDDADLILDVVEQYLRLIDGDDETKKRIIRRYATVIGEDLQQQIYASKEEHTEFIYNVQQDLIVFGSFAKTKLKHVYGKLGYKKEVADKKNIKNYLFEGYRKSYYPVNSFDSDDERRFAVVLEDDEDVVRFIKPPLNQLGLFYRAGKQYNPDFLVETKNCKYMVEVKAANQVNNEDVQEKARAGVKWCECASKVDADGKEWKYRLVSGEDIIIGNTLKYILGLAVEVKNIDK
ncbi:DEAD/DEAH box helicase [Blautia wexlerae]|uniref:DEAD/DEAH box helicase n=2 Tax=Blautia wexlerae TaxID=418240 RepID=UPI00157048F4|nr:DEAD/DEAH box helicase family protein [Blautia wexlerae]MCB5556832.1 DEAD/DEAH box helicase family protein [Blautia wexlerae]NSG02696.1 DEAD/DEAH box helicase family protein [Blautia wexlerae]